MKSWASRRSGTIHSLVVCIAILLPATNVRAQEQSINPPFGLHWGEDAMTIERLLKGAKATVIERETIQNREAWTVEGLIQASLKRTVFYFREGQLVEVELQYEDPEWNALKYNDFMAAVRRKIESKYGTGRLIARQKTPEGGVLQTIVGYKWEQNNTAIQLVYFCAENANFNYRTVSVHYKGN